MKKIFIFIQLLLTSIVCYSQKTSYYSYTQSYYYYIQGREYVPYSERIREHKEDTLPIHSFAMGMGGGFSTRKGLNGFSGDFFIKYKRFEQAFVMGFQKHKTHTCGNSDMSFYFGFGGYVADMKYWSCSIGGLLGWVSVDLDRCHCKYHVHNQNELQYCAVLVEDTKTKFSGGIYIRNIFWLNSNSDKTLKIGLTNMTGLVCYEGAFTTFGLAIGV